MRTALLTAALILVGLMGSSLSAGPAWLDGDANAIWSRPPGFYKDGNDWYAIVHVRSTVSSVRLAGDFTAGIDHAVDLRQTPDGKFWWFKGPDTAFVRPPAAGDKYRFVLQDGSNLKACQDPAARRVENSGLGSHSLVTVSSDFVWHDAGWSRPQWSRHLIYQVHPLRFTSRNRDQNGKTLPPLQQLTEELDHDGTNDYLNNVGGGTIQLLPVNEFAGDIGWGYNPSFFYAVESSYESPDDLKALVDTAHKNRIAVILDLVYNHGGSGDNILWDIAQENLHSGTYYYLGAKQRHIVSAA